MSSRGTVPACSLKNSKSRLLSSERRSERNRSASRLQKSLPLFVFKWLR